MKKYAVLKLYKYNSPDFRASFDKYDDAVQFANLLTKSEDTQFAVVETKYVTGSGS